MEFPLAQFVDVVVQVVLSDGFWLKFVCGRFKHLQVLRFFDELDKNVNNALLIWIFLVLWSFFENRVKLGILLFLLLLCDKLLDLLKELRFLDLCFPLVVEVVHHFIWVVPGIFVAFEHLVPLVLIVGCPICNIWSPILDYLLSGFLSNLEFGLGLVWFDIVLFTPDSALNNLKSVVH